MNLRYMLYDAPPLHADIVMKNLGITYRKAVPQSMYDQWWFFDCENVPDELPDFIQPLDIEGEY